MTTLQKVETLQGQFALAEAEALKDNLASRFEDSATWIELMTETENAVRLLFPPPAEDPIAKMLAEMEERRIASLRRLQAWRGLPPVPPEPFTRKHQPVVGTGECDAWPYNTDMWKDR